MFALYFVTHCQLYSCRVFSDITSTWHKYFILGIFLKTFPCVEIKMDQNDSIVSCPWLLCADTAASKWEQKARKSVYEIINSCLLYLSQSMRYLTSAYIIYAADENWSAMEAFCNLSAAYLLILNIHLLRKTCRLDNSLPNVQYVYISIRRKEEKCSVKLALFCFFNAHNSPDVKGSSFK